MLKRRVLRVPAELYIDANGWVATNQAGGQPAWPDAPPAYSQSANSGNTRATWLPYLVQQAKAAGINRAQQYEVITDASNNPVAFRLAAPVLLDMQYAINGERPNRHALHPRTHASRK